MKTVLITSFHVLISRNILVTPFLDLLRRRGDLRVVLLVPEKKKSFFERAFAGPNVVVQAAPRRLGRLDGLLRDFAVTALGTRAARLRSRIGWGVEFRRLQPLLAWLRWMPRAVPWLYRRFIPADAFADVFETWRPSLVFATDVFGLVDARLLHEALLRGVPTVGMVRSWDNLTTKGVFRVLPDIVVVQNPILRDQAIRIHGLPADMIRVVGIPHYDRYLGGPKHSREQLMRLVGLDPGRRFVVYGPIGALLTRSMVDQDAIVALSRLLPPTHQLLVRHRPSDTVRGEHWQNLANVVAYRPGVHFGARTDAVADNELSVEDDDVLISTLAHADLLVTVIATLIIDAAVLDRPIVLVRDPAYADAAAYFDDEHFLPILASGGVRVVPLGEPLRAAIFDSLADPGSDAAGRKRLVEEQCWRLDGRSSERLVAVLRERLG